MTRRTDVPVIRTIQGEELEQMRAQARTKVEQARKSGNFDKIDAASKSLEMLEDAAVVYK